MNTPSGARDPFAAWRLADEAFEQADSRGARAAAMMRQLQAREQVERWSWAERQLPGELRRWAIEEGLWSVEEALDRLARIDFVERHRFIGSQLALFPDTALPALLDLLRRPQPGDGVIWYPNASALTAAATRLARAGRHEAALDAIRAVGARRAEALRRCAPLLPGPLVERMIVEIESWIPGEPPEVRFISLCELLPLLSGAARERARGEIVRLRAGFEDGSWEAPWDLHARRDAAIAFADAGMLDASEAECEELDSADDLLAVARKHPRASRGRITRMARARGASPAPLDEAAETTPDAEPDPEEAAPARERGAAEPAPPVPVEPAEARLGKRLFGPQGAERISTDEGFALVLEFAEHYATGEHIALLVEVARALEGERREALCRALLDSGESLWSVPGFKEIFSPEQRKEHLRAEISMYERPAEVSIHDTLRIAATLVEGEQRRAVLGLFVEEVRKLHGRCRLEGLCAAVALADGALRTGLLDEALRWIETGEGLDEGARIQGIAAVLPLLPLERAAPLAERILDAIAAGQVGPSFAGDRLMAIPDALWAALPEARWAPAIRWVLEEGPDFVGWGAFLSRSLPAPLRAALEERAQREAEEAREGARAAPREFTATSTPRDRLRAWAGAWASLSDAERAAIAPEIEAAVRGILDMPDTEDRGLREALSILPESAMRAIWSARGRASAWRRTIDLTDPALFAYIASEHYLHAEAVIRLVLGLGGPSAVVELARMLVALGSEEAGA